MDALPPRMGAEQRSHFYCRTPDMKAKEAIYHVITVLHIEAHSFAAEIVDLTLPSTVIPPSTAIRPCIDRSICVPVPPLPRFRLIQSGD
jgi:hypothetical protein